LPRAILSFRAEADNQRRRIRRYQPAAEPDLPALACAASRRTPAGSYIGEQLLQSALAGRQWGANYPRLRKVKSKYDPTGLFFVHHGVGSEDWSDDGFTRL
jgi:hypothetical protein